MKNKTTHKIPKDLQKTIMAVPLLLEKWKGLTPLAQNEWMCWVLSAKKIETRERRIERTKEQILEGKKRPCCWAGCIHR